MSIEKQLIESVRQKFLKEYEENPNLYYKADADRVRTNDWSVERFALVHKKEEATLKALVKAMKWRKEFGLLDRTDQDFPLELYQSASTYPNYCKDKEGRPILLCVSKNNFKSDMSTIFKQFYFHQVEKLDSQTSHQGWNLIASNKGCGMANIDMDLSFFIFGTLQDCFPKGIKYMIIVDVPFLLSASWKILANFMSEEFRNTLLLISKEKLLEEHVDREQISTFFGGTNEKSFVWMPEGVQPLDKMPQFGLSEKQIEKIRNTYKDVLKENGF